MKDTWLLDYKSDTYSLKGEDGVILKILDVIKDTDKWCVEFGAWDGIKYSNTRNLIENHGYSAILIEADTARYKDLKRNNSKNNKITAINRFVGYDADDNLDKILGETSIPLQFDFLSIDIDGNDYHTWKAMNHYTPKVICIEFNPTIPKEVLFVQKADPKINQGSSLTAHVELGKEKGYEVVAIMPCNAIFVKKEYFPLFQIEDNSLAALQTNFDSITYIFSGFDGKIFLAGNRRLPWHNIGLKEKKFQPLPKFLQKYPENYGTLERLAFKIFTFLAMSG